MPYPRPAQLARLSQFSKTEILEALGRDCRAEPIAATMIALLEQKRESDPIPTPELLEKRMAAVESRLQQLPDEIRAICEENDETLEKKIVKMIYGKDPGGESE